MTNSESIAGGKALVPPLEKGFTRTSFLQQAWRCIALVGLAYVSYFCISHFLLQSVTVTGVSMSPNLADSQRYLLNRWIFHVRDPHREEVVVLRDPMDDGFSVKRVVGVAGDIVYLKGGAVYLNGHKLNEGYLALGTPTFAQGHAREQLFKCGPGEFFLMGDNRGNSIDSRVYGPVGRKNILGLVIH